MSAIRKISLAGAILGIWATGTGCPTLPDQVSGTSTGAASGENIEWLATQVDPPGENTAGFNQVISADLNADGLVDLITAAYESQPIQIHLQQRSSDGTITFRSLSVAGSGPIVQISELKVADIDQDGNMDIIVCSQDNGFAVADECASKQCSILILFAPPDPSEALLWEEFNLTLNYRCQLTQTNDVVLVECNDDGDCPEEEICRDNQCVGPCVTDDDCIDDNLNSIASCSEGACFSRNVDNFLTRGFDGNERCYASLDVGYVNEDVFPDILAAFNGCDDDQITTKQVELWINPADDRIRTNETLLPGATLTYTTRGGAPDGCAARVDSSWQKVILQSNFVDISSVRLTDVDIDGDLDVVSLRPDSKTFDLTWQANPLIPDGAADVDFWGGTTGSRLQPIGESDMGFDFVEIGDLDGDGLEDVLALGQADRLIRWFRHPKDPAAQDFPWDVFNMVQYTVLIPTAVDIADLDLNGQLDVVAAADGRIRWFTPTAESSFEPWSEQIVADDPLIPDGSSQSTSSAFPPINSVHAVDIDGDGRLDIAATLDREGVDNDLLIWIRNQEVEEE